MHSYIRPPFLFCAAERGAGLSPLGKIERRLIPSSISQANKNESLPLTESGIENGVHAGTHAGGDRLFDRGKSSLCLFETREKPAHLHLAFTARSRPQVDAFHRAALAAGGQNNGAPGLRPNYHANYYAAFVMGPDGHNLEAVCHAPEA